MAANFNKIMLMGNLTRDPELAYLPNNTPVVKLGLAVNRRFRRQDGEQGEETLFIDCEAFARTAEVINQYLRKGSPLFVEGRLKLDRWQDRDGNPRSKHRVVVENFQFIDSPQDRQGGGGGGGGQGGYSQAGGAPAGGGQAPPPPEPGPDVNDDDIPF